MTSVVRKIDDIGRIAIPKDVRRSLRWMGGDEIEVILNDDDTILLRKYKNDTVEKLRQMSAEWSDDADVEQQFLELMALIESRKN